MKRLILSTALLMVIMASVSSAQLALRVMDTLYARTEVNTDPPLRLRFGLDTAYTDGIDYKGPEFEIPAIPPSFYGAFRYQRQTPPEQGGDSSMYLNADFRGVPDSVGNGTVRRFTMNYVFEVFRNGADGRFLYLEFIRNLSRYIDSVNITDVVTNGLLLNHTFTKDGGQVLVNNDGLVLFRMVVYINLDLAAVPTELADRGSRAGLRLWPNPLRVGQRLTISEAIPAGARVMLTDVRGNATEVFRAAEEREGLGLDLPALAPGLYMIRVIDPTGGVLRDGRVILAD